MLMVSVVHGRYCAIGTPVRTDVRAAPVFMTAGAAVQSAAGVCEGVFVLLSGYSGICPAARR